MKKTPTLFALTLSLSLSLLRPLPALVDWFDPAYLEANTQDYGTGFVTVPTAAVVPHGWLSAGLHRYRIKVNYGLWSALELGMAVDVEPDQEGTIDLRNISQKSLLYGRVRFLRQDRHGLHFSVGAQGIGWEEMGMGAAGFLPDPAFQHQEAYYAVAGRTLPWVPSVVVTAGLMASPPYTQDLGSGIKLDRPMESWFIGNVSHVVFDGLLAMAEMDRDGYNFGLRVLLSAEIKLDLNLYQAQIITTSGPFAGVLERNIRFGISYTEKWPDY